MRLQQHGAEPVVQAWRRLCMQCWRNTTLCSAQAAGEECGLLMLQTAVYMLHWHQLDGSVKVRCTEASPKSLGGTLA
jgi:hypothetical protein